MKKLTMFALAALALLCAADTSDARCRQRTRERHRIVHRERHVFRSSAPACAACQPAPAPELIPPPKAK